MNRHTAPGIVRVKLGLRYPQTGIATTPFLGSTIPRQHDHHIIGTEFDRIGARQVDQYAVEIARIVVGEAVAPILALEIAEKGSTGDTRTIYYGSLLKTLAHDLRMVFVVANSSIIRKLLLMKQATDLHSSTINQIAIAHVAERHFPEQVTKIKAAYSARRNAMLKALEKYMPAGSSWTKPEGGMFVWVTLPEGMDGATLLARSVETEKVAFVPGQVFFADRSGANTLRLSFSCANEEMIDEGIKRLGRLIGGAMQQAA